MPVGVVGAITPWNFPIAIPSWKLMPGARLRQHGRAQAGRGHAVPRPSASSSCSREAGVPAGRRRTSCTASARRPATRSSRHPDVPVITLHGLARDRRRGDEGGGRPAQARPPRARRQERDHRDGRRRPRPRGRRDRLVGVRHDRPALHRGLARDRPRGGLRRAAVEARRARRGAAARAGLGGRHRRRAADQPRGAREGPRATRRSARTRARSS